MKAICAVKNANIWPGWELISEVKQLCHPVSLGIRVDPAGQDAMVSLKNLLNLYLDSILKIPYVIVKIEELRRNTDGTIKLVLYFKNGTDGSGGKFEFLKYYFIE